MLDEKEVLVEKVDESYHSKKTGNNSSLNLGHNDEAIDQFLSNETGVGDSEIRANMKSSRFSYLAGDHGFTANQGALAILSTCVGAGIVGLPLAMYNLGLPLAMFLQVLVIILTHTSSNMYLYVKDIVPDHPDSLYEIGYMIVGRASIFGLGSVFFLNSVGLCMIYFIVFGDTAGQLVASFTDNEELDSIWYTSRWFYDIILAALLLPICLKKELAELAWVSYVLFISLALFTLVNFI